VDAAPVAPEAVPETPVASEKVSETESMGSGTVVGMGTAVGTGTVADDAASEMRIAHASLVDIAVFETVPIDEEIGSSATTGVARAVAASSRTNKPSVLRCVAGRIMSPPAPIVSLQSPYPPAGLHERLGTTWRFV
jgi:hypothetical protein